MKTPFRALALAAGAACVIAGPSHAQTAPLWETWGQADLTALIEEGGGKVTQVLHDTDGDLQLVTEWGAGSFAVFDGQNCTGAAEAMRCRGAILSVRFDLNDMAKARKAAQDVDAAFLSETVTEDGDYIIMRYIELGGGVTRENVKINIGGFLDLAGKVGTEALAPG